MPYRDEEIMVIKAPSFLNPTDHTLVAHHILQQEESENTSHTATVRSSPTPPDTYGSDLPPTATASDLSIPTTSNEPACKRLISCAFSPHQVISLIEVIFTNTNEAKKVHDLHGGDVQTFIDITHKV